MSTPRFAANLKWLLTEVPLAARFDAAADAGFAAVEVPNPYGLSTSEFDRLRTDAGLEVTLINTPPGPAGSPTQFGAACLPDHIPAFRDGVERGLDYAAAVGCPLLHIVGGRVDDAEDMSSTRRRTNAFATYVTNIGWAAQRAAGTGVSIVIEMQNQRSAPGFILRSQDEAAAVADAAGDTVGILFDFFHTQVAEGDISTVLRRHADRIRHIQIGDAPARTEPGTGELRWRYLFEQIAEIGYTGWLGCEFTANGDESGLLGRLKELV